MGHVPEGGSAAKPTRRRTAKLSAQPINARLTAKGFARPPPPGVLDPNDSRGHRALPWQTAAAQSAAYSSGGVTVVVPEPCR
jgi:hypothetical protein